MARNSSRNLKTRQRLVIDGAMTLLTSMLMAYMLVGEFVHEVLGTAMAILLAMHLWLNRAWFRSMFRGRFTRRRAIQTLVICLAALCTMATVATGIVTSRYVFTSLPVHAESSTLELVHMTCSHWGLVLMGLHAGLSAKRYALPLLKRHPRAKWPFYVFVLLASCWGASAIVRRGIWRYLLLLNHFAFMDPTEAALPFIFDYLAAMLLFGVVGALLPHIGRRANKGSCAPANNNRKERKL